MESDNRSSAVTGPNRLVRSWASTSAVMAVPYHDSRNSLQVALALEHLGEEIHFLAEERILADQRLNAAAGMQHRGVVAAAEAPADLRQRAGGELARQVHRHLPGARHPAGPLRRMEVLDVELVEFSRLPLDVLDRGFGAGRG